MSETHLLILDALALCLAPLPRALYRGTLSRVGCGACSGYRRKAERLLTRVTQRLEGKKVVVNLMAKP
jgi:hypothetical protein